MSRATAVSLPWRRRYASSVRTSSACCSPSASGPRVRSANSRISLSGRPNTNVNGPRYSNIVTAPSPLMARPMTTACSAWRSARCAPVAPRFGPPTPAERPSSAVARARRTRSASAWARASTEVANSRNAATMPVRDRTTRASGTSSATDTRRRAAITASRDANAIARYSADPFVVRSSPTNKEGLPFGRPSWKSAFVIRASRCPPNAMRPPHKWGGRRASGRGAVPCEERGYRAGCTGSIPAHVGLAWQAQDCVRFEGAVATAKGRFRLATFITLARYTQQGVSKIKDSPTRVDNFRNAAQKAGGSLKSMYLTLGRYDLVLITEAPSDDVVVRLTLATASLGNVTTETLRAFSEDEFRKIVSSLP